MIRVTDVLRRHVYRVGADTPVISAARQLMLYGIESLLVVDGERLVGIVSERDLLAAMLPDVHDMFSSEGLVALSDLREVASDRWMLPVSAVMTRDVIVIAPSSSLLKALGLMLSRRLRRLPVVDPDSGGLVGLITQRDLLGEVFLGTDAGAPARPIPGQQ